MKSAAVAVLMAAAFCAAARAASGASGPVPVPEAGGARPLVPAIIENPVAEDAGAPQWTAQKRHDSIHFTIVADFDDPGYFRKLQWDLEKYFSVMQKEFWEFIPPQWREARIEVIAFGTQQGFDAYAKNDAGLPHGERGYSSASAPRIVYMRQDLYYRDVMILVHELTHVFNRFCCAHTPIWLDEGLAQFYANYAGQEQGNTLLADGVNADALATVDGALRAGRFVELADLLMMKDEAFYGKSSDVNYAESWALVYFLRRAGGGGDDRFGQFYQAVARGADPYAAFSDTYGQSFDIIRRMWLIGLERLYAGATSRQGAPPRAIPAGERFGEEPPASDDSRKIRVTAPVNPAAAKDTEAKRDK